ncbi:MAG: hypothetical protein R3E89_15585 [Thiolinea sp.]
MSEPPRKTLTIKRPPAPDTSAPTPAENAPQGLQRSRKRIIKRDDLPAAKLGKPKAPQRKSRRPRNRRTSPSRSNHRLTCGRKSWLRA